MTGFRMIATNSSFCSVAARGQYILNLVGEAARRAADRSRFAALSRRYLDDAGLTPGELYAALRGAGALDPRALAHSV